ncbi:hypothetical protein BASA60_009381 [Batrachochytrium salamandrivorans]|nr:hypothetical protein BASA60_009381 [Batrachochytrium salamandrivorans]KAH9256546.1 hypothetical protein BASA81_005235 [Batrachochytrium salamandrivorans]
MQFFHLFSFVVAASYAAALPQPAGLSEKYSNNVNTNLAFGLEARSYQPELNSYKESATLMSLKRRDDSGESPDTTPDETPEIDIQEINPHLEKAESDSLMLSSTINEVEDGIVDAPENLKSAGEAIRGGPGEKLIEYVQKATYVSGALKDWVEDAVKEIILVVEDSFDLTEHSKAVESLWKTKEKLIKEIDECLKEIIITLAKIARKTGPSRLRLKTIRVSFEHVFLMHTEFFGELQTQLANVENSKKINEYLSNAIGSLTQFVKNQKDLFDSMIEEIKASLPK